MEPPSPEVRFDDRGLVPCVIQDWRSGEVLTLAYMNAEALALTPRHRRAAPVQPLAATSSGTRARPPGTRRRSRPCASTATTTPCSRWWSPKGPACHTGERTCFFTRRHGRAALRGAARPGAHDRTSAIANPTGYTGQLLADPPFIGEKVQEEAEEVARAAREESDERVAEEAADVLYHLTVLLASRGLTPRTTPRRCSLAAVAEHLEVTPTLEETRALTGRPQPRPDHAQLHRGLRDARLRVPEAARRRPGVPAGVRRAGPARRPLVVHRLPPEARHALEPRRRGRPVHAGRARRCPSTARREIAGLPPFAGGAVGFFGFDCVRAVERLPEPNPDALGLPDMALMLSDVIVAFDHLRHTVTILANAYLDDDTPVETAHARAVEAIRAVRTRLAGPLPQARAARPARGAEVRVQHDPRGLRGQRRADHRVHPRRRRLPGGPVAALERADPGRAVLDLPRPARGEPVAVHVLPRLRGLPDRRRVARAAADGQRPPRLHPPDRRHPARAARTTTRSPPSCSPTRRSAPST